MTAILDTITGVGTAVGVLVGAWQLWQAHQQTVTSFEDSFSREYRELTADLPTKALLGESLTEEEYSEHFDEFYHYFDLSNEQAFLFLTGRVRTRTWKFWKDGIEANLGRPAFRRAWSEISERAPADFEELRTFFPPESMRNPRCSPSGE